MSHTTNTNEPILKENPNRFVLFPIEHNDIWEIYKKAEASFGPQKRLTSTRT
jgi:ribonucleoside-diphosphate reductase beta chain